MSYASDRCAFRTVRRRGYSDTPWLELETSSKLYRRQRFPGRMIVVPAAPIKWIGSLPNTRACSLDIFRSDRSGMPSTVMPCFVAMGSPWPCRPDHSGGVRLPQGPEPSVKIRQLGPILVVYLGDSDVAGFPGCSTPKPERFLLSLRTFESS